jgi:hypothetical protein
MKDLYRKEVEEDLRKIAYLPATDGHLQEEFEGKHLHFFKGTSALEVIHEFEQAYDYACSWIASKDSFDIFSELAQKPNRFLSAQLEELLSW